MRRKAPLTGTGILLALALLAGAFVFQYLNHAAPAAAAVQDGISVFFSPRGDCTAAIVDQLDAARATILVQAYSFTSKPIAEALLRAHKRGVKVTAILDKEAAQGRYTEATFLHNQGMTVYVDGRHQIAHNKIMLIDGATLITGSFNFTRQAEEDNAENLLIISNKPLLLAAYQQNFEAHRQHSEPYAPP